ncbi:MAG: hypothetical protein H6834_08740 [Planctomycetes bacterium]|nr:hypothetical protein [Planctomycetota bacterium]
MRALADERSAGLLHQVLADVDGDRDVAGLGESFPELLVDARLVVRRPPLATMTVDAHDGGELRRTIRRTRDRQHGTERSSRRRSQRHRMLDVRIESAFLPHERIERNVVRVHRHGELRAQRLPARAAATPERPRDANRAGSAHRGT